MRRRHAVTHENHERWLVSYADFITLLFAFFVVMFASTQSDREKARQVSASVKEALEHGEFSSAISTVLGRGRHESSRVTADPAGVRSTDGSSPLREEPPSHPADLAKTLEILKVGLAEEVGSGKIGLRLERRGLIVSLHESGFFASGEDAVAPSSLESLARIAAETRTTSNPIRFEGHTDSIPIHTPRFRSNWELSAARAIAMMELFRERFGINPQRMSIAGYAESAPADTNETAEGRSRNRRVDLVVLSEEGEKSEPHSQIVNQQPGGR
jgi:chemotaxis protein MotB